MPSDTTSTDFPNGSDGAALVASALTFAVRSLAPHPARSTRSTNPGGVCSDFSAKILEHLPFLLGRKDCVTLLRHLGGGFHLICHQDIVNDRLF